LDRLVIIGEQILECPNWAWVLPKKEKKKKKKG